MQPVAETPVAPPAPTVNTTPVPKAEPFSVPNRSRAERAVKLLFGAAGRTWINRASSPEGMEASAPLVVQVGTETGSARKVLGEGFTFTDALAPLVESYLKGGGTYADTKLRIVRMATALGSKGSVAEFVEPALAQFEAEHTAAKDAHDRALERRFKALAQQGEDLRLGPPIP